MAHVDPKVEMISASPTFMPRVSTPPNTIVCGSGRVSIVQMVRGVVLLEVVCCVLLLMMLVILCPLLGLT